MATLAEIAGVLISALTELGPSPGSETFKTVGYFAGEVTQAGVDEQLCGEVPGAFLSFETDEEIVKESVRTLAKGNSSVVTRTVWRVYVVVQDPRGEETAHVGLSSDGLFPLTDAVIEILNGLPETSLLRGNVSYLGTRPAFTLRGVTYVWAVRFATEREAPGVTETAGETPDLTEIQALIDIVNADNEDLEYDDFSGFEINY